MKVKKIIIVLCFVGFVISCMAYDWKKWQASFDLAVPDQFVYRLKMEKYILLEGEPLLIRCVLVNHSQTPAKIILAPTDRIEALEYHNIVYEVSRANGSVCGYFMRIHSDIASRKEQERLLKPGDTVCINGILWPDNFFNLKERKIVSLSPDSYVVFSRIYLGTKFLPKPARTLFIHSDTARFIIEPVLRKEELTKIRPFMAEFFGYGEENTVSDSCREFAYSVLDEIRKSGSYLAPYADFVYIGMLAFDGDRGKLDKGIIEANKFIKKYKGSMLGEEMEYLLVKMIYRKEGKSKEFYNQAQRVMKKYSQNINNFGVKRLLEGK